MAKGLRSTVAAIGLIAAFSLSGCAALVPGLASNQSDFNPIEVEVELQPGQTQSAVVSLTDSDRARASMALKPEVVKSGSYIVVTGYDYFDTLTALNLDGGERVYFATKGQKPFAGSQGGMTVAATEESLKITGFGAGSEIDPAVKADAEKLYADYSEALGTE